MADEPTGGGNHNFWTTFKGKYTHTPEASGVWDSEVVMLSCVNDVQIIGDCELTNYVAGATLTTLSPECTPGKVVKIPVCANDGVDDRVIIMTVNMDGTITLPFDYTTGHLYLSGINFNISDNWY